MGLHLCDNAFNSRSALLSHKKLCFGNRTKDYPKRNKITGKVQVQKFRNIKHLTHHPFVVNADSESFLKTNVQKKGRKYN